VIGVPGAWDVEEELLRKQSTIYSVIFGILPALERVDIIMGLRIYQVSSVFHKSIGENTDEFAIANELYTEPLEEEIFCFALNPANPPATPCYLTYNTESLCYHYSIDESFIWWPHASG